MSTPAETERLPEGFGNCKASRGSCKGKTTILRCMCHEVNGVGANFGPRLEGWAAKQSTSAIIHAIINPSQGIAHGFPGNRIHS